MSDKITVRKSYKFRIYPSKSQIAKLETTLDLCRELYNAALQERRDAWRLNKISISYYDQCKQLPETKKIRQDLTSVYAQVLQDILRRLDKTFTAFFSRIKKGEKAGFPRFKNENRFSSFCYPQAKGAFRLEGNKLYLSKIGKIKIRQHRLIQGKLKNLTIHRTSTGKWFAVFLVETAETLLKPTNKSIGLDVGLHHFAVLSNGEVISNPRFFNTEKVNLAKVQRRLSKSLKGTNKRVKLRKIVSRIYERITNRRNNFAHQLGRKLVDNYDNIFFEDLNIQGMMKNHHLSNAIGDAAWNQLILLTTYKAEKAGRTLKLINPKNTSQICSTCGETVKKDLTVRIHDCRKCGLKIDRDLNAAINILTLGLQSLGLTALKAS